MATNTHVFCARNCFPQRKASPHSITNHFKLTAKDYVFKSATSLALLLDNSVSAHEYAGQNYSLRAEAIELTRDAYVALYETPQALTPAVLHALASITAQHQGAAELAEHHRAASLKADPSLKSDAAAEDLMGEALPKDPKLRAIFEHVDLITVSPALVERDDQLALQIAGITADEIVLISQVVAFTSFLLRTLYTLELLAGREPASVPDRAAGKTRVTGARGRHPHRLNSATSSANRTYRGSEIPQEFTRDVLAWEPWVPAVPENELTEEQAESFAAKATTSSEYFRLLSRVPAILKARSALDNVVFLGKDGLPRGERELVATVASRVNDCIYCASVHARKAEFQTKRADDIDRLLAATLKRDADWLAEDVVALATGQDTRWTVLIDFAAKLSELKPTATIQDIEALAREGLTPPMIADAAFATAFFAWANRLMLSLGEAAVPGTSQD